jgi:hypothetical protein
MSNVVPVKQRGTEIVVAGDDFDPYTALANTLAPKNIFGTLLKFNKGDWLAGETGEEITRGTQFVAIVPEMTTGYVRWDDKKPIDQRMVKVSEGYAPNRSDLGDLDKSLWEVDEYNKPKDPWAFTMYLPLLAKDGSMFTFSSGSAGGKSALTTLSRAYGPKRKSGQLPVVALGTSSYEHEKYGKTKVPTLTIVKWIDRSTVEAQIRAGLEGGNTVGGGVEDENFGRVQSENPSAGFDDEIPF